jgi:hypothetical protein
MKIIHDRYYLNLWAEQREAGFTQEIANKIVFDADMKDNRSIEAFQTIKDWLEDNFIMYQYKKDNGVKYGEHELFYWVSWQTPERYWTIDFNENLSFDRQIELLNQIVKYLEDNFSNVSSTVRLQYKNCMDWNLVNNYVSNLVVDYSSLPYEKLKAIFHFQFNDWKNLSKDNADKLLNIQQELLQSLENKKVVYNGIKGTLKKIDNYGTYGVFKPRATRQYLKIGLGYIDSLEIA